MHEVLFLAAAGRSGSTLLGMVLGQLPQFFNVGEIKWFWSDAHDGQRLCGCGEPLCSCPFWAGVTSDLRRQGVSISRVATTLVPQLTRTIQLPRILVGELSSRPTSHWREFVEATARLYEAVHERCQGKIIVDGSKLPPHLRLLQALPDQDLRLLHIVRDGRAVAYSWHKRWIAKKGEQPSKNFRVSHRSASKAFLIWMIQNHIIERLCRSDYRHAKIRYEDFATNPRASLQRALRLLDIESDLSWLEAEEVRLRRTHAIAGSSRVRFGAECRAIVLDDEWRRKMGSGTLRGLSLLGLIPLRRYGYRIQLSGGFPSAPS